MRPETSTRPRPYFARSRSVLKMKRLNPAPLARQPVIAIAALAISLAGAPSPLAQSNAKDASCTPTSPAPAGVSVHITLDSSQTELHEGEIIPVTVEYSASQTNTYLYNNRSYDRSARLGQIDEICLDPANGTDPLADYFKKGVFIGGGLFSVDYLNAEPKTIHLELNEWLSIPPGSYHLRIAGHRVGLPGEKGKYDMSGEPFSLLSNEIEFTVTPATPEWRAQALAEAVSTLDSADPKSEEAHHAARTLRFLGTEGAMREMARRYWAGNESPNGWEFRLGLYNPSHRAAAIEEMKAEIADPAHPVSQEFIRALADLEMFSNPKYDLPPYDPNKQDEYEAFMKQRDAAENAIIADLEAQAAAVLSKKTGPARAVSAAELLIGNKPVAEPQRSEMIDVLIRSWDTLPPEKQSEILTFRWDRVASPSWLPILRAIAAAPPAKADEFQAPSRGIAILRVYQISPSDGRDLILHEIENPRGGVRMDALGVLPDHELPQYDATMLKNIQSDNRADIDFQLLDRYASAAIYPQVKKVYEGHGGMWACAPQTALLRYMIRIHPDEGAQALTSALAEQQHTGCYRDQLANLGDALRTPVIEKQAIRALDDSTLDIAQSAAEGLGKYGSADAEPKLWARLEKLRTIQSKEPAAPAEPSINATPRSLESHLVDAILSGNAWLAGGASMERLEAIVSLEEQKKIRFYLDAWKTGTLALNLTWFGVNFSYDLANYRGDSVAMLGAKLSQFPAGVHITTLLSPADLAEHTSELQSIRDAASAAGLRLEITSPE